MAINLYWIVQPDATATPTGAQIVAGLNGAGAAALASGSEPYTSAGTYSEASAFTGLTGGTAYEQAWVAFDGSTYSTVVTATITTPSNVSAALAGQAAVASAGTLNSALAQSIAGSSATASAGAISQAITQALSGSAATVSAGTLTASVGSGNDVALVGSSVGTSAGTLTPALSIPLTGSAATVTAGSAVAAIAQAMSGSASTVSAGTLTAVVDANVTVALTGATVSVIAGDITRLGGASAIVVGGGSPAPARRKFVYRVGKRLYISDSEENAESQAEQDQADEDEAEDIARKAVAKAKRVLPKSAETVSVPTAGIDLESIRSVAVEYEKARQFDQMLKREQYARIMTLYKRLQDQIDEDEVAMVLSL